MSGTVVEELIVTLGLEADEGKIKGVTGALEKLVSVGEMLVIAFGFEKIAEGVFAMVEQVGNIGDQAAFTAEKIGITTQALQELEHAAIISNASAEALANGMKFLGKNAAEAIQGSTELRTEFARVGVQLRGQDGKLKPTDQLLEEIAGNFGKLGTTAEQSALMIKLFGRAGTELLPMMHKGKAGIAALRKEAHDLGLVMSDETIEAAGKFDEALKDVRASFQGLRNTIAGPFLTAFGQILERITRFIILNRKLIASKLEIFFKGVAKAANLFLDALEWLFANSNRIEFVLFALTTGVLAAAAAFVFLQGAAIASALATAATWMLALVPFILIGAFLALIIDDLWTFVQDGDSMTGRLIKWASAVKPEDNDLTRTLKLWIALLTDLGDPAKWEAVKAQMASLVFGQPKMKLLSAEDAAKQNADTRAKAPAENKSSLWDLAFDKRSGSDMERLTEMGRRAWNAVGAPNGSAITPSGAGSNTVVNAPVTIVVPPNTPPEQVRDYVKEAIDSHFDNRLREAGALVRN